MCISAQDIKGAGRVITMTIWKNLGGVHKNQWANWYPHHKDVRAFIELQTQKTNKPAMIRDITKGTAVYATFEKLPTPSAREATIHWYTPALSRRVVEVLNGKPRAADPRLGSWLGQIPTFRD